MARTRQKRKAKQRQQQQQQQATRRDATAKQQPTNPAEEAAIQTADALEAGRRARGDRGRAGAGRRGRPPQEADPEDADARRSRDALPRAEESQRKEPRRERKPAPEKRKEPRQRGRVVNFLVQVWAELRRVQWPDRNQVTQATGVVDRLLFPRRRVPRVLGLRLRRARHINTLMRWIEMFRWYVINTYSGHENKVKHNIEHRVSTMEQQSNIRQVVVPTEQVSEMKNGQKVQTERRTMPGYVLVNMEMNDDTWTLVKNTPGVTGFVGSRDKPLPLSKPEVDRLMHRETAERPRTRAQFSIGESVKVISGPLSDFSGEIAEINEDAAKLKVLVSIFGRETPVEVGYDQVKKI